MPCPVSRKRSNAWRLSVMEQWRTISDYPGYEVSDCGRVRRRTAGKRTFAGRILLAGDRGNGYLRVCLRDMGRVKTAFVHHLVAEAFHGPRPAVHWHAAHLNGNRRDNRSVNLAWVSPDENEKHKLRHGTQACGEKQGSSKLSAADVEFILRFERYRGSYLILASKFSVSPSTIGLIVRRKTWRHITP